AYDILNMQEFLNAGIKAIFSGRVENGNVVVSIQKFSSQQILQHRRLTLILGGEVLNQLTSPAFTLDNKLVGVIRDQTLIFKSFFNIRTIFDLSAIYSAATDNDIDDFAGHKCLDVADVEALKNEVDQVSRKLIHGIRKLNILDNHDAAVIQAEAWTVGIDV